MKEYFADALREYDGLFTAESVDDRTCGTTRYYFSYHGDPENYILDCVCFCNTATKSTQYRLGDVLYFSFTDKSFFSFDRSSWGFRTNVYMKDYSTIEKFKGKCHLTVVVSNFTLEQQEHLKSIQNDYSFEIILQ